MAYWVYNDCDNWIYDTDGVAVSYWEGDDETGRLAAAAPELLEALKAARRGYANLIELHLLPSAAYDDAARMYIAQMDAAIGKAEGK